MARALLGHVGSTHDQLLAFEVVRLRRRIAELEAEVAGLREVGAHAAASVGIDTATSVDIDLELHRITETSTPALA